MSIPKTTKWTLKKIVENLESIPDGDGFGTEPKKLTSEQKKQLMEMAAMFEKYGEVFKNETAIMDSAKSMTQLCELAETYALNECGEQFQTEIVKKDMIGMKKRVQEYGKLAKECYAKTQQLRVAHEDIGHILDRYYDTKALAEAYNQSVDSAPMTSLQMESHNGSFKPCTDCGKLLYRGEECAACKDTLDESISKNNFLAD